MDSPADLLNACIDMNLIYFHTCFSELWSGWHVLAVTVGGGSRMGKELITVVAFECFVSARCIRQK